MENTDKKLRIVYGDVTLGLHGKDFSYIFSYQTGGLESLVIQGKEWLYRTPKPTFWRALTDNDRGSSFQYKSGMWLGADLFLPCKEIAVSVDGMEIELPIAPHNNKYSEKSFAQSVKLTFAYETITVPSTNVFVDYCVNAAGRIHVDMRYQGKAGLPGLPAFGMRFVMPTKAAGYRYEGLSGETYPDRKAGSSRGIFEVEGLPVTPYLVPQECGMHVDTKWVAVYRDTVLDNRQREVSKTGLRFEAVEGVFGFSCLPFTAEELENATHQEELPPERRTVLCIMGAVRGVGGIDSWGTDIEEAYRIDAEKDIAFSFDVFGD
ncbi:MAG: beta-galactosidase small subunit [Clostridium sp.]|nr:beta-galactosidase small subunit [Clostridium sp.]